MNREYSIVGISIIIVGFMFLGMGIGYFMDNLLAGASIGMELGFLGKAMLTRND